MTRPTRLTLPAVLAAVLCASGSVGAQPRRMSLPDSTTFTVTAENGVPEIPFELINNHLILPVSVNGGLFVITAYDLRGKALKAYRRQRRRR